MPIQRRYSPTECFEFFGVIPKNNRWSWSGRSEDGSVVAVRLWQDGFENAGRVYRSWATDKPDEWKSRPGFVELIENLAHARDELGGQVEVIIVVAQDRKARPRSIARSFPQPELKMRVVELDEAAGTFVLERIG
ncbi:hypothetical protein K3172_12690 [Qipengyuania sp. 6B39]|uniref:hypothetical protein n=1 Tax=Qipengyuania proteolytica TaxID=2867239 RepID=UPI001C8A254C|nr:hypothetical protein [Qipengyuania proteolytica]MBX7496715.1 hypothetical protein [Qipengyuania proteolytica]